MAKRAVLVVLLALVGWNPLVWAEETTIHSELRRVNLRQELPGYTINTMENGWWEYSFDTETDISLSGAMATQGEGRWWVTADNGIAAKGTASGGPCHDPEEEDCDTRWPWSMKLQDIWVAESGLMRITDNGSTSYYECTSDCLPAAETAIKLVPGHRDKQLYNKVLDHYRSDPDSLIVAGAPAKNPRSKTEIWWVGEHRQLAQKHAATLRGIVGPVDVKEWTFGNSPYSLIIVVGTDEKKAATKAKPGPLKVKLMDGQCPSKKACQSKPFVAIEKILKATADLKLTTGVAKNKRKSTEVWYQPGYKERAQKLVDQHLKGKVKATNIKEWTWGGDFEVLVIVGE